MISDLHMVRVMSGTRGTALHATVRQPHSTSFGLVLKAGSSVVSKNPARRIKCHAGPCVSSIASKLPFGVWRICTRYKEHKDGILYYRLHV